MVIQGMLDPSVLEALACKEALALAQDLGLHHLQTASDSQEVVKSIRDGAGGAVEAIIWEIQQRKFSFISCNYVHEFRATNYKAHKIATHGTILS